MFFLKFLLIILVMETISCFDFGKLVINDQKGKDDLEFKNDHGSVLITTFTNAKIASAAKNGSSMTAKITFSRDTSGQHNYALVHEVENDQKIAHYSLEWVNPLANEEFCTHIGGDQHWYYTYEEWNQNWPMSTQEHVNMPMAPDSLGIMENLFLGSSGFGVYVEKNAPLFMRRDNNKGNPVLCFSGDYHKFPYNHAMDTKETKIVIHLLGGTDIMHVYRYAAKQWIPKPQGIPDQRMIKYPIWSTWAKYHSNINQEKVLEYAKEITSHGFPNSQLEIDDRWESKYGDFSFDPKKFPNPKQMTATLKSQGYRTTLWVYPFVNQDSAAFHQNSKHFLKAQDGSVLVNNWWNGHGAHVDFSNKEAQNWFVQRVEHIRNSTGIDSFKFDAGELNYLNHNFKFSDNAVNQNPSLLTKLYAETASKLGNMIEMRVGYSAQHLPFFVRMIDKSSSWTYGNGIRNLIPSALMMSIAGYPFAMPDMIGGNAYGNFPSKEMYIRWIQINTFMPTLQFSITPWDFKESSAEVINVTKAMLKLRDQYSSLIISLAENAVKTGEPIMRPLWWVAPTDPKTYTIDDQFLVGNDLMAAPVTTDNSRQRNIYIPAGNWKDHKGVVHKGPQLLKDFKCDLHELPYFTRQ